MRNSTAREGGEMNEMEMDYDRQAQTQAAHMLGMKETFDQLDNGVSYLPVEQRVNELLSDFDLLSKEEIINNYTAGSNVANENFAVIRAIEMVNELPVEPSIARGELCSVHDDLVHSEKGLDASSAWIMAAEKVVGKYSQQKQQEQAIYM
jgi:hypothetical protein